MTSIEDHLWTWASTAYGRGAAKTVLIDVQDRFGLHVNTILWSAWCGAAGHGVQRVEILNAIEIADQWSGRVTAALRDARRGVRMVPARFFSQKAGDLYEDIKVIELAAEKLELGMLAKLVASNEAIIEFARQPPNPLERHRTGEAMNIARRNVMAYLAEIKVARLHGFSVTPIERILQEIFQATASSQGHGK
ncbi:MAG: TIGR02444 family protein [Pseudomonadota bacterium]